MVYADLSITSSRTPKPWVASSNLVARSSKINNDAASQPQVSLSNPKEILLWDVRTFDEDDGE